ncbi:MAG: RNA polymerase factor sigma-54 [Candidatus Goldbacteria bacterium]|nr:RNA polymerase factor sigma-54 [Candidatus Goldiibacteriota bacterium]
MDLRNNLNLQQELKQQLRLTHETKLSLDILQATYMELEDILNQELVNNPIIEDITIRKPEEKSINREESKEEMEENIKESDEENTFESFDKIETEENEEYNKVVDYHYNSIKQIEQKDLQTHLLEKLDEMNIENQELYNAAKALILELDDNGFLSITIDEVAVETGLSKEIIEKALEIIQSINEPSGIGARNILESLLIQLRHKNLTDSLAYKIVKLHFELLEKKQYEKLAQIFKVTVDDIKNAEKIIKECDPYPGKSFKIVENPVYVIPDIIVTEDEGNLKVNIMGSEIDIKVNKSYLEEYKKNSKTKDFIEKYQKNVKDLIEALDKRNKTIQKIVELILNIQKDYIINPESGLKPLTLKEIADAIGVHESTVSRTVSRKYIQLPSGVYPLKSFFSQKLQTNYGDISNKVVQEKIKNLIENEDKDNPLTDTEITEILNKEGINISRRTVTKYRENLGIMSVNMRK